MYTEINGIFNVSKKLGYHTSIKFGNMATYEGVLFLSSMTISEYKFF